MDQCYVRWELSLSTVRLGGKQPVPRGNAKHQSAFTGGTRLNPRIRCCPDASFLASSFWDTPKCRQLMVANGVDPDSAAYSMLMKSCNLPELEDLEKPWFILLPSKLDHFLQYQPAMDFYRFEAQFFCVAKKQLKESRKEGNQTAVSPPFTHTWCILMSSVEKWMTFKPARVVLKSCHHTPQWNCSRKIGVVWFTFKRDQTINLDFHIKGAFPTGTWLLRTSIMFHHSF